MGGAVTSRATGFVPAGGAHARHLLDVAARTWALEERGFSNGTEEEVDADEVVVAVVLGNRLAAGRQTLDLAWCPSLNGHEFLDSF